MHQIEQHAQAEPMRDIDQMLQFLGRAEARGRREEVADVIAERSVVRMFLNGHQLDRVVTGLGDARQYVRRELIVRADLSVFLRHADMRFVNSQTTAMFRPRMLKLIRLFGVPILTDELIVGLLNRTSDVRRNAIDGLAAFLDDRHLHARAVHELVLVLLIRQEDRPHAELIAHERAVVAVPTVEVADQSKLQRPRRPLAIPDAWLVVERASVEPEVFVPRADLPEQSAGLIDLSLDVPVIVVPFAKLAAVRAEHRIKLDDSGSIRRAD